MGFALLVFCLFGFAVLFIWQGGIVGLILGIVLLLCAAYVAITSAIPGFSLIGGKGGLSKGVQSGFEASRAINENEIDRRSKASKLKKKLSKAKKDK